jgi:hypothetical protein
MEGDVSTPVILKTGTAKSNGCPEEFIYAPWRDEYS